MPTINEQTLASWTKPGFATEDEKRDETERSIRAAIKQHSTLKELPVSVYAKGSYKNNTNVRRDSDVDVAVELTSVYMPEFEEGVTKASVNFEPYSDPYPTENFKDDVEEALDAAFGSAVKRRNKVFRIRANSTALAADVVPCYTHRWFYAARPGAYHDGIQLIPDDGSWPPHNFPAQHYENGVAKNKATGRSFKGVVRILKRLENQMVKDGAIVAVPSYLIECLVYNAPNSCFTNQTWAADVRCVLAHIWEDTEEPECEKRWFEVNGIKYLFHVAQRWSRKQARDFAWEAWQYVKDS